MRVGFTGARKGMTLNQEKSFLSYIKSLSDIIEFHHGDCVGADARADELMRSISSRWQIIIHPPVNSKYRAWCSGDIILPEKEYLERNQEIVDLTDILVACSGTNFEMKRSGTWSTVRYSRKQEKDRVIIYPTGEINVEQATMG